MAQDADYRAFRSPAKMAAMCALLAVAGCVFLFVDFSTLVPETATSRTARGGQRFLEFFATAAPYFGGFVLVTVAIIALTRLRKTVEIEVSADGIAYPPSLEEVLPWDRIERIAVRKMTIYRVLAVFIKDADNFPIKSMPRTIAEMNKRSGDFGDINIETMRSEGDFDALVAAVEVYHPVETL